MNENGNGPKRAIDAIVDRVVAVLGVGNDPDWNATVASAVREAIVDTWQEPCLLKSWWGEPLFVIRSTDRSGPGGVRDWQRRAFAIGASWEKTDGAAAIAVKMEKWAAEHPSLVKTPD